jgi:hypothetical protein
VFRPALSVTPSRTSGLDTSINAIVALASVLPFAVVEGTLSAEVTQKTIFNATGKLVEHGAKAIGLYPINQASIDKRGQHRPNLDGASRVVIPIPLFTGRGVVIDRPAVYHHRLQHLLLGPCQLHDHHLHPKRDQPIILAEEIDLIAAKIASISSSFTSNRSLRFTVVSACFSFHLAACSASSVTSPVGMW